MPRIAGLGNGEINQQHQIEVFNLNDSENNNGRESIRELAEKIKNNEFTDDEKVIIYNESGASCKGHVIQRTGLAD